MIWADWDAGVEYIRIMLKCSVGKAQKIMENAAASGEVQVKKDGNVVGPVHPRGLTFLGWRIETRAIHIADLKYWFGENYPNAAAQKRKKGGAPAKADWPAISEAIRREITERGRPDRLNVKGWRCQADVESRIMDLARNDGTPIGEATARRYARKILSKKGS